MTKYNFEFKLKVVQEYRNNDVSYSSLMNKYGIKCSSQIISWLNSYKQFGERGLQPSKQDKTYSIQFKLNAIELYVTTKKSYQEVANAIGINNHSLIANWLIQFRDKGIDGLSKPKGRPPKMTKQDNLSKTDKDKIKELEAQLLTLQIENAYLKELRKLRKQEEKQRMKLSRPSSLASEENSN